MLGGTRATTPDSPLAWALPLALLCVSVIAVPLMILEPEGLPRYRALESELREVRRANLEMASEIQALSADVGLLRQDTSALERIARDELGMVREGEIVFLFPD